MTPFPSAYRQPSLVSLKGRRDLAPTLLRLLPSGN